MGLGDLLSPLVELMIDWLRLREGSLKQMGLLARRGNEGLATMSAHTQAPLSGRVTVAEVEMAGSNGRGERLTTYSLKTPVDTSAHPLESYAA